MTGSWIINVSGQTYGPYDATQMQAFAAEGRLARQSLVARAGDTVFRSAIDEPELAAIFSSGQRATEPVLVQTTRHEPSAGFGRGNEQTRSDERSHFVIVADMKSGSVAKLEDAIATLGQSYPILPQAWLLASGETVNAVRNLLIQQLGKLDMLFIVDAGKDKAAWFNFGPEADARIRKIWHSEPKLQAAG